MKHRYAFCIKHQSMDWVWENKYNRGEFFHTTIIPSTQFDPAEIDTCEGPFAECEPPVMTEEDWDILFSTEMPLVEAMVPADLLENLYLY